MTRDKNKSYIRIAISGSESQIPTVEEIGLFLADFATLYELHRLSADPYYGDFVFSRFALYRNGRPIDDEDKLYVEKIKHESPIELMIFLAAGAAGVTTTLRGLVESLEKIYNFRLNRELLEQNLRNAELDEEKKKLEIQELREKRRHKLLTVDTVEAESRTTIESHSPATWIHRVERRLEKNSIRIERLEIVFVNPEDNENRNQSVHDWQENNDNE